MKTKICSLLLAMMSASTFAQSGWVGINTPNPQANLDINGTMKIRQTPAASTLSGYQMLAVNQNTGGDSQVVQVAPQVIADYIMTSGANTSVYSAKKSSGITLINVGILPNGFRPVNFLTTERTTGTASLFSDSDNTYTAPSTGIYAIGFSFRYGTGIQSGVLTTTPSIAILRNRAGTSTIIDTSDFSGVNLGLVSLTISEGSINSLYSLQAGDKISFGLTNNTVLDLGLLGSSTGSFYIYKVSN
ncbi:hypothetical protein QX233_10845 [Chryseobacterium gambrini]|uniref:C1q domain-containing protein n=1 Tax=Chryseobacterium gambrini TaxID=373672 RepID=A0AAJ1VKF9_9FLAO|nr:MULTISPECIES: hypothetical protein [Chryseobacterium]MDN4012961.1 hypothetical protein [Chryseobacterium gambrini]MDN4030762.1 hypothetical protein [Chryseobacterium gambrini]QWA38632.1 hypothetical protein KKI44_22665 [Chryseobacterium sp. ZHDP1]